MRAKSSHTARSRHPGTDLRRRSARQRGGESELGRRIARRSGPDRRRTDPVCVDFARQRPQRPHRPAGRKATEALSAYRVARSSLAHPKTGFVDEKALFLSVRGQRLGCAKSGGFSIERRRRAVCRRATRTPCGTATRRIFGIGADPRSIQELGHQNLSTTARYAHVDLQYLWDQYQHHPHAQSRANPTENTDRGRKDHKAP